MTLYDPQPEFQGHDII